MSSLCTNPDEGFFAFSEYSFKRFVMLVYSLRRATMDEDSTRIFDALFVHRALDPVVLTAFRKYCAADESSASYLDSLKEENLASFIRSIFEAVLKGFDERGKPPELMDDEKRFRRLALQCLVNAANRSRRLFLESEILNKGNRWERKGGGGGRESIWHALFENMRSFLRF